MPVVWWLEFKENQMKNEPDSKHAYKKIRRTLHHVLSYRSCFFQEKPEIVLRK